MPSPRPTRFERGRWCEEHARWECTKPRKRGGPCHGYRIVGLDACRMHAGQRGEVAKAKGAAITAFSALAGTATVTTTDAVLGMLQMSWLRVHMYAQLLERQVGDAQAAELAAGAGGDDRDDVGPGTGLVGHTFGAVKDVGIYATGEAVRGLALLEAQERDRCVRYAKTAHDMGIAEAQVALAEAQGAMLAGVLGRVLDRLDLTDEQRVLAGSVVPEELRAVAPEAPG